MQCLGNVQLTALHSFKSPDVFRLLTSRLVPTSRFFECKVFQHTWRFLQYRVWCHLRYPTCVFCDSWYQPYAFCDLQYQRCNMKFCIVKRELGLLSLRQKFFHKNGLAKDLHTTKKAQQFRCNVKVILSRFQWSCSLWIFASKSNSQLSVLCHVLQFFCNFCKKKIRNKRLELYENSRFFIMIMYSALSLCQFYSKNRMTILPQPPYSPDLAHCNFSCS